MTKRFIAAAFILLCWFGSTPAAEVQYCGSGGVPKDTLKKWDQHVRLLSRAELEQAEAAHLPWGSPACSRRLFSPYYIDCYDTARRAPLWVAYRLEGADVLVGDRKEAAARAKADREGKTYRRTESFRTDPRLLAAPRPSLGLALAPRLHPRMTQEAAPNETQIQHPVNTGFRS